MGKLSKRPVIKLKPGFTHCQVFGRRTGHRILIHPQQVATVIQAIQQVVTMATAPECAIDVKTTGRGHQGIYRLS